MQTRLSPRAPRATTPRTAFAPEPLPRSRIRAMRAQPRPYPSWERRLANWLRTPDQVVPFFSEAIVWAAGGLLFRVATHLLLMAAPQFWIPVAIALMMPAVMALGLSLLMPKLARILGYRLCLIAAGLFLARFWL